MSKRPVYLTIIALSLIVWGGLWLVVYTLQLIGHPNLGQLFGRNVRTIVLYIDTYLFLATCVICGVGLFRGYRWTRFLFVSYGIVHFIIIFMNRPLSLFLTARTLVPIAIFLVMSIAVFLPEVMERTKDRTDHDESATQGNQRLKDYKFVGICVSFVPIFYIFLLSMSGSMLPFDILQLNFERLLFEGVPFLHLMVIFVCSIPTTIYIYSRLERKYRNVVFLLIVGLVSLTLYCVALYLFTLVFFFGVFRIFGAM